MNEGILRVTITEENRAKNRWWCETKVSTYVLEYTNLADLERDIFARAVRKPDGSKNIYFPSPLLGNGTRIALQTGELSRMYIDLIERKDGVLFSSGWHSRNIPKHMSREVSDWLAHCETRRDKEAEENKPYTLIP